MRCPYCGHMETKVLDSRDAEDLAVTRRRRECEKCEFRFSTREETEILNLSVIKRDGRHEPYSRDKIEAGLIRALEKRPISKLEFRALMAAIEQDISALGKQEVKTSKIGEIVIRHLKKLDKVAYIRFASVYHDFTDVASFYDELSKLVGKRDYRTRAHRNNKKKRTRPRQNRTRK